MSVDIRVAETPGQRAIEAVGTCPSVLYDPRLAEDAVFLALRDHAEAKAFEQERDRLYEMTDVEEREFAFHRLYGSWFSRLGLAEPIVSALTEQSLLISALNCCFVACAIGRKQEGADLLVSHEQGTSEIERRTLRLLVQPESLLDPAALRNFLRHEFFHIRDMVDSQFGYEPELPSAEAGPTHDRLLLDRYRVLWDTTIDGRMVRLQWAPDSIRAVRLKEFTLTFPMLGDKTLQMFQRFFDCEHPTHLELVTVAQEPRAVLGGPPDGLQRGSRCPLCRFPTYDFEPNSNSLPAAVTGKIQQDFPLWCPSQGLCTQCADLYRSQYRILPTLSS